MILLRSLAHVIPNSLHGDLRIICLIKTATIHTLITCAPHYHLHINFLIHLHIETLTFHIYIFRIISKATIT